MIDVRPRQDVPRPRRGPVLAVDHISFEARPGEIFGLLGPNGAGKTTTMRILCTVLRADRRHGHASPASTSATQAGQVRQHIGFMSANTAIYDRMSAWEMVEYFGRLYGLERGAAAAAHGGGVRDAADERLPRHARREDEHRHAAEGVDRPGDHPRPAGADLRRADRRPRRAGGAGGAARTSNGCATLGKCILFSTHIMREVERLCDRVAIVSRGRIQACGTLAELRERHGQDDLEELFFSAA